MTKKKINNDLESFYYETSLKKDVLMIENYAWLNTVGNWMPILE